MTVKTTQAAIAAITNNAPTTSMGVRFEMKDGSRFWITARASGPLVYTESKVGTHAHSLVTSAQPHGTPVANKPSSLVRWVGAGKLSNETVTSLVAMAGWAK